MTTTANGVRFLSPAGPMTVVHAAFATTAERDRTLTRSRALDIVGQLCRDDGTGGDRHTVFDIHRLLTRGRLAESPRPDSSRLTEQVLAAIGRGLLLVVDGWEFHDAWTPRRFYDGSSSGLSGDTRASPEARLVRRVLGGRGHLSFEGARYFLVPVQSWDDLRAQQRLEVVHHQQAAAILRKMATSATNTATAALNEAAGLLADTTKRFVQTGLFLARRMELASAGGTHSGPPAATPSSLHPPPPPPDKPPVNPTLTISAPKVILVKKDFQAHPHRLSIRLGTDRAFDGTGVLSGTNAGGLRVYQTANEGGDGQTLPLSALAGAPLSAGMTLFLEARAPSAAMDDVKLTLHLDGGSSPRGPDVDDKLTCVELTLDICASRTAAGVDPAPLATADKLGVGRFVQHNDPNFHHGRAKLIVRKPVPTAFTGTLQLRALDAKVQAFAAAQEVPAAGQAAVATTAPESIDCAGIPPTGHVVWAEGVTTSGALSDTGFALDLQAIPLAEHADKVVMTVAEFTQVQATIKSTPPNTARVGFPLPADHVYQSNSLNPDFAADQPLVLMRNAQPDIALVVTCAPANLPVRWAAVRNPADHATLGAAGAIPTVTEIPATPTTATLSADNRGSFWIRAFIDCNGNNTYNDGEPSIPLKLILADVTVVSDTSAAFNGHLVSQLAGGVVNVRNGTWPGSWAACLAAGGAGMTMELTADVTGGGADGRLGLDSVFGGLVNMLTGPNITTLYRDSTVAPPVDYPVNNIYATNNAAATGNYAGSPMFLPGDPAPVQFATPFLDTGRGSGGSGGETATMGRSGVWDPAPTNRPVGQRRTLRCIDSPGRGFLLQHPTHAAAQLLSIHYEQLFRANFCFWTNVSHGRGATGDPADRVYSVVRTMNWEVHGEWTINVVGGVPTLVNTTPHTIAVNGGATVNPIGRAQDNGVEVRPPSGITMGICWTTT